MRNLLAGIRRARQRGLSLIEAAMVLAVAALVVAGVMLFFQNANNAQKTNDAMSQLAAIQQVVRSLYAGQPDYTGLTSNLLAQSRQLPNRMVKGTGGTASLQHSFNGVVTVLPQNAAANFSVQFAGLPGEACNKMATMDLGTGLVSLAVTGGTATTVSGRTMTPVEANTACGTGNGASLTWTFF